MMTAGNVDNPVNEPDIYVWANGDVCHVYAGDVLNDKDIQWCFCTKDLFIPFQYSVSLSLLASLFCRNWRNFEKYTWPSLETKRRLSPSLQTFHL